MENIKEDENVEGKIDRLNNVITDLLKGFEDSRSEHDKFSMISPIDSFNTSFADSFNQFSEISFESHNLPQEIFEKFQENLTEIDRLKMKIEDISSNYLRDDNSFYEILISKDQIQSLNNDTQKLLQENAENALIKIGKSIFFIESISKPDKIIYYPQHIYKTSQNFSVHLKENFEISNSISNSSKKPQNHLKNYTDLELKQLSISKKEENLRKAEEELGYKMQKFEIMKNEFYSKVSEGKKNIEKKDKNYSKTARENPNDKTLNYFTRKGIQNKCHEVYKTITILEDLEKKSFSKASPLKTPSANHLDSSSSNVYSKYLHKKSQFFETFSQSLTNKESYILNYLHQQSAMLETKFKELQNYENYLYETWIENFGENKALAIVHNKSKRNFQMAMDLNHQREVIDQKSMRIQKLIEITKSENNRLEFHRKKIMNERHILSKQQAEIENAFEKLLSMATPNNL